MRARPSSVLAALFLLSSMTAAQIVTVSSPANNSLVSSPVHYVASATSPGCSKGIAAMRIYLADHVTGYNVQANVIDTFLTLSPGNYGTVVQAWDNCGGVAKAAVNITVTPDALRPVRFLYIADQNFGRVLGFTVDPNTGVPKATGQNPPTTPSSYRIASDKEGYRLYVTDGVWATGVGHVFGYFIDRRNGYLFPVPGSPVTLSQNTGPVVVHPSGKFVFVGTLYASGGDGVLVFKVNPDGSLTAVNPTPFPTQGSLRTLIVDGYGKYLYALSDVADTIDAFAIDTYSGALTPLPGSPYKVSPPACPGLFPEPTDMTKPYNHLYTADLFSAAISGFNVAGGTGTLTEAAGSPFTFGGGCASQLYPVFLIAELSGRFLYVLDGTLKNFSLYSINAGNGALTHTKDIPAFLGASFLRGDPSGKFLYIKSSVGYSDALAGFSIDPLTGALTELPGSPFPTGTYVSFFDLVATP